MSLQLPPLQQSLYATLVKTLYLQFTPEKGGNGKPSDSPLQGRVCLLPLHMKSKLEIG